MSIEALIAAQTEALNKNTETALALIAALKVTSENQERLIAGQSAAIEKVEPAKRTRAKKDEPAAATAPAAETKPAEPAKPAVTVDQLKTLASGWLNENADPAVRKTRGEFLKSVATHFGKAALIGAPDAEKPGINDADGLKQAVFFISRAKEGLKVDFNAEYDFDGDVTQGGESEPAADDSDDLGI